MALYPWEPYVIARGALFVVTGWIPASALFFCACCLARRKKDPARTAFTYLKAALVLFASYCFFDACASALLIAGNRTREDLNYYDSYNVLNAIAIAQSSTSLIANFLDKLVDILVMIMLLRISTGIVIAQSGHAGPIGKILRLASYALGFLLLILTIAVLGLQIRYVAAFYDGYLTFSREESQAEDAYSKGFQIDFAFRVLVFVAALGIVARAVMVKMQPRAEKTLSWCSTMLIAMSVVWLLRTTYNMASIATWANLTHPERPTGKYENYYNILDVVFSLWPQFTVLCMAFFLGTAKSNGLWSTQQPFMPNQGNQGNQQTAWGYGYNNGAQPAAPPMVHQPQQQQAQYQQPQPQQQYQPPQQQYQPQHQQQYHQPQPVSPTQQAWQHQPAWQPQPQPQQAYTAPSPVSHTTSPPPHEENMGLNHQADGQTPSPYGAKIAL